MALGTTFEWRLLPMEGLQLIDLILVGQNSMKHTRISRRFKCLVPKGCKALHMVLCLFQWVFWASRLE